MDLARRALLERIESARALAERIERLRKNFPQRPAAPFGGATRPTGPTRDPQNETRLKMLVLKNETFDILKVDLFSSHGWRFGFKNHEFDADIRDFKFMADVVSRRLEFGYGDMVRVNAVFYGPIEDPKTRCVITEVLEFIHFVP